MVNWRTGLLLLLLLAVLVVFAFLTRPRPPEPEPQLLACPSQDMVLLRIQGGDRLVELQRPTNRDPWQVTQPRQGPADSESVNYLIGSVTTVRKLNVIERPGPPVTYGLDQPRQLLTCRVVTGASYNLSVGNQSFDGSGYYAQKSGDDRVFVISGAAVDAFDRALVEPPVKPSPTPST